MPFKSQAQQRYMYSQHPEIAHRWSDEMRGGKKAPKFQREHPIKAANLPDRVGKRFGIKLRKPKTSAPFLRQGVTRMGTVGVEYVHQGTKGWGASETAARAAWEQNHHASRFASGTSVGRNVEKGFTAQSVKPVLARRMPAAGGLAKPSMRKMAKPEPVAKAGLAEIGRVARMAPKAAGAGWKAGVKGGKPRMALGTATAMGHSPALRRIGQAGQMAGEHQGLAGLGTGIVTGSVLGGMASRDVNKAHGDPEDSRYYRMGAGSAVLGAGGAAGLGYAVNDARKTSRIARAGSPMGVHNMRDVQLFVADKDEIKAKRGTRSQVNLRNVDPKAVHRADRLARHGVAITRRGALAGAGGLAALAGAETLRRQAHERRYN